MRLDKVAAQNAPHPEDRIEALLERLPAEHHETWRRKVERAESPDAAVALLEEAIKRRAEAVRPAEHHSDHLTIAEKPPKDLGVRMRRIERYAETINAGNNGRIIRCLRQDPTRPSIVYKVLLRPPIHPQNSLRSEAAFLADLHRLSADNPAIRVRVPKPFYFVSHGGYDILAQEEVTTCVSVKDIIEQNIPIPPALDIEAIFAEIRRFVALMHDNGYYHRDLREGNIMINLDPAPRSGEPLAFIVDMGYCVQAWSDEEANRNLDAPKDNVIVESVKRKLEHRRDLQQEGI